MTRFEKSTQGAIIILTLGGVLGLSMFGRPSAPLAAAGVAILLLLRFGVISNLIVKAFGAEVAISKAEEAKNEIDKAVVKAEETVEALKESTLALSLLSIVEAFSNNYATAPLISDLRDALGRRKMLSSALADVGFSHNELEKRMSSTIDPLFLTHLYGKAALEAEIDKPIFSSVLEEMKMILDKGTKDIYQIRDLYKQHGLSGQNRIAEAWLGVAEEFAATKDIDFEKLLSVIEETDKSSSNLD